MPGVREHCPPREAGGIVTALINLAWFLLVWLLAGITVLVWWYIAGRALDVYAQRRDHAKKAGR